MKQFNDSLKELNDSSVFKEWRKDNPKCYLSYGFIIVKGDDTWRIGYYHPDNQEVSSFLIAKEIIQEPTDEEAFQKPECDVKELKPKEIKTNCEDALKTAEKLQKEKSKQEIPLKIVVIVQNHNELGNIWNITYVTQNFKTLNIKVDAGSGDVLKDELIELFHFDNRKE